MTRRSAVLSTLGLGGALAASAGAREFWIDKTPATWNDADVQQMLSKSPWAKEASIFDSTGYGSPLAAGRGGGGNRRGRTSGAGPSGPAAVSPSIWKAVVRWESALPVRDALKIPKTPEMEEYYIIGLIGDVPAAGVPLDDDDPAERKLKLATLQENTRIERRDDPLSLQRVGSTPRTPRFPSGTLFYFSRAIPITPEDKALTFVTKIGPLEVKCKFGLRDMVYHGKIEL